MGGSERAGRDVRWRRGSGSRLSRRRVLQLCAAGIGLRSLLAHEGATWAGQRWFDERTVGPLHVHADFTLADFPGLLADVQTLQGDLCQLLEVPPARDPIHLFLFDRKPTYLAYLREYFPRVPYRRALYVKERGPGMVLAFRSPEFDVDVRHETTHALLHAVLPDIPLWLDEGLAEYFEVGREGRADGHPYLPQLRWQVRVGEVPRVEDLEGLVDVEALGRSEYRAAWGWVHFLLHGPGGLRGELVRYLTDLRSGVPSERLGVRLLRRMPDRDQQFAEHFKQFQA